MRRVLLAVGVGYAAAAVIVMVGTLAAGTAFGMTPGSAPSTRYLAANVAVSLLGAATAGYLSARLAPPSRITLTVGLLVMVFLVLALVSARVSADVGQPRSYLALVTLLGIIGLWTGVMIERAIHARETVRRAD
jgi:hypothetical protein